MSFSQATTLFAEMLKRKELRDKLQQTNMGKKMGGSGGKVGTIGYISKIFFLYHALNHRLF